MSRASRYELAHLLGNGGHGRWVTDLVVLVVRGLGRVVGGLVCTLDTVGACQRRYATQYAGALRTWA